MKKLLPYLQFALSLAAIVVAGFALRGQPPVPHKLGINGPSSWNVAHWYFDPANSTGCASDANTCQSATCSSGGVGPCVTHAQIVSRLGTISPEFSIAVTETQLSDQSPSQLLSDPITLTPSLITPLGNYTFTGTLIQVTTATIGTFTTRNLSAGTPDKITASGQSGAYWTTFLHDFVHDTTANGWFWIERDFGSATAQITNPLEAADPAVLRMPRVTIANGDSLIVYRMTKSNIADIVQSTFGSLFTATVQHVTLTGGTGGNSGFTAGLFGFTNLLEFTTDTNYAMETGVINGSGFVVNGLIQGLLSPNPADIYGGAITTAFPNFSSSPLSPMTLEGGVLLDPGTEWHFSSGLQILDAYIADPPDTDGVFGPLQIGTYDNASGVMWGPASFDAHDATRVVCYGGCTANLLLTGALTMHGQTTGYPWIQGTGSYGAATTITRANIDANNGLFDPRTGDGFMNHP